MPLEFENMCDLSPSPKQGQSFAQAHSPSKNLGDFVGSCTVFSMETGDGDISADEVQQALSIIEEELKRFQEKYGKDSFTQSRFLFKTKNNDGTGGRFLSQEALKVLTDAGAQLVGIDMPKLIVQDHFDAPKFSYIVNLCLDFIEPGYHYQLLAPPLLMPEIDPVPVRPILVS